jgi:hypothetical protein
VPELPGEQVPKEDISISTKADISIPILHEFHLAGAPPQGELPFDQTPEIDPAEPELIPEFSFGQSLLDHTIADTRGHIQYTRNMVTGASTADLAVIQAHPVESGDSRSGAWAAIVSRSST